MSYFVIDVESDGPVAGLYSMVCFGAIKVDDSLDKTFYGKTKPISDKYKSEALEISGFSRKEHLTFDEPQIVMQNFADWIKDNSVGRPIFLSDNNGFDFAFINYYFHLCNIENPFGWTSRRIGDIFCGYYNNLFYQWKRHRKTSHTHNPVDDAKGNAEALLYLKNEGLNIHLK